MGSLLTQSPPGSSHQIYVAFCSKGSDHDTKFSNWIARFNPCDTAWSYVTSIPGLLNNHVLKDFAMMSIEESIYVIGGRLCRKEMNIHGDSTGSDDFFEINVQVLSTVLRYNVNSDQWSHCAPLCRPRYNFACTVCDNKIYVAGGQYEVESAKSTSLVETYDPLVNEWVKLPDLKRLRCKCIGVTWQNKVHVVGGFVKGCDPGLLRAYVDRCSAEVHDVKRGQWDLVPGMWQLDIPPNQIVSVEGRLFSSGDCLNAWKGHIEEYDKELNMWNLVEGSQMNCETQTMHQLLYVTMAPIGPYLYFLTGCKVIGDVSRTLTQVYRFNTTAKQNAWTSFDPLQEERQREICTHCCVVTHSHP